MVAPATTAPLTTEEQIFIEWKKCELSPGYFINTYCSIYDATMGVWIPFELWPEQLSTLKMIHANQLTIVLKARQLGLTWLLLGYALWLMIFRPISTVLLFSRRDEDSMYLIGEERLRGMYNRLPEWLRADSELVSSSHHWKLSNGSNAKSFPTTGGDSYTASFVLIDEADLIPDLNKLLRASKPTIDAGGKMVMISRSDKTTPESEFKKIYIFAKRGENGWVHVFLPWYVRPARTREWYENQKREIASRTGSLDDLYEQYPETDAQALAPRSLDKRLNPVWLADAYEEMLPYFGVGPALPGIMVYDMPQRDHTYVVGIDPAEGNPSSDDSSIHVICRETGEEVCSLSGKFEPVVTAAYADSIGRFFKNASVMPERNNHGHAVIAWLSENSSLRLLLGLDGRPGWMSSVKGKALLYDSFADGLRNGEIKVHTFDTFVQLSSIEGSSLRAPEGQYDDRAVSFALTWAAIAQSTVFPIMRQAAIKGRNT